MLRWISSTAAVDRVGAGEEEEPLPLGRGRTASPTRQRRRARRRPSRARRGRGASRPRPAWRSTPRRRRRRALAGDRGRASRSALSRITSSSTLACASRSRSTGSSKAPLSLRQRRPRRRARARSRPAGRAWRRRARSRAGPSRPASPSPGSPTTRSAAVRAPVKKTSLNSEPPVSCSIGRTSTPSWSIGTSRKDSPWWRCGAGLGAGDDEASSRRLVGVRRPDLLAVDDPLVAVERAPWSARWRGRSRRRARSSPGTTAPRRRGSAAGSAACCSAVPKAIRVGPSSSSPRWLTRAGALGAGVLLVEDHLLRTGVSPRPPCSSGQPTQVQPCSARCRFQASRSSYASCSRPGPPRPRSVGELAGQVLGEPGRAPRRGRPRRRRESVRSTRA